MRQKSNSNALSSEEMVKGIRWATRKRCSAEEKIRISWMACAASIRCTQGLASSRAGHITHSEQRGDLFLHPPKRIGPAPFGGGAAEESGWGT